jgi:hypothetical protein
MTRSSSICESSTRCVIDDNMKVRHRRVASPVAAKMEVSHRRVAAPVVTMKASHRRVVPPVANKEKPA